MYTEQEQQQLQSLNAELDKFNHQKNLYYHKLDSVLLTLNHFVKNGTLTRDKSKTTNPDKHYTVNWISYYTAQNADPNDITQFLHARELYDVVNKKHLDIIGMNGKIKKIEKQIKGIENQVKRRQIANLEINGTVQPRITIPEKDIPAKIRTGKTSFNNPFFEGHDDFYAGSPDHFDWTRQMKNNYIVLKDMLNRMGIPPFETIYASRQNGMSFAAIAANGDLVWRKYDPSPGAGQNWIYVNGTKLHTSHILSLIQQGDQKQLNKLFKSVMGTQP